MYLYELQASTIDKELEDTARTIGKGGQPSDPNAPQGAPEASTGPMTDPNDPLGGEEPNMPDPGMLDDPSADEIEIAKTKKIDSYVVASIKGHPYISDYRHRSNSKISPDKIIQMDMDQLVQLRNLVRNKISLNSINDQFGLYDDPGMKFYQDMISFVEKIIDGKKLATKNLPNKSSSGKKVSFKNADEPNTKPGKVKKPNRGGK